MSWKVARKAWEQGVSSLHVSATLATELEALGWKLDQREGKISITNPLTKTMSLAGLETRDDAEIARLLAHEITHVRQFHGGLLRRLGRCLAYLLWPPARIAAEVEARAHALYTWARMFRSLDMGRRVVARAAGAGVLAGWNLPYLTGGNAKKIERATLARLEELIDG